MGLDDPQPRLYNMRLKVAGGYQMVIVIRLHEEVFKPVTYPGIKKNRYMVSNYGRILDLKYNFFKKLKPHQQNGYVYGKFKMEDGKKKTIAIHRIVAYEFVKGYDEGNGRIYVNHRNGIKHDNYFENLEWVTSSENNYHRFQHGAGGTNPPIYRGEESPQNVYSENMIRKICELLEKGCSYMDIMRKFGFNRQNDNKPLYNLIYDIKQKRSWTHISKDYNF